MNWFATLYWLTFIIFCWWLGDAISYSEWINPEYHKSQRNRVYILAAIWIIASAILIGLAF